MSTAGRLAVFLDRDGTLNELVWHEEYGEWGPPWSAAQLVLKPGAADLLRDLRAIGYLVFVVTNQPDAAKGKATLEALSAVEQTFNERLSAEGAKLDGYEQCLHHPDATVAEFRLACACRKPGTGMIDTLAQRHQVDLSRSWMVGDRDSDVICGRRAGLRTIALAEPRTSAPASAADPDYTAETLASVFAILKHHAPRLHS